MELLYDILTGINQVILGVFAAAFSLQLLYFLLFFLPAKKYKTAPELKRFGIIICARNEAVVIKNCLKSVLALNYPKELFDVFVVADNCTDNTAAIAREQGVQVFERFDQDPNHHRVAYALAYGFEQILNNGVAYDAFVRFDADDIIHPDYLLEMNNAYCSGVKLARGHNASSNMGQNLVTTISGLWYLRDLRFGCQPRSCLNISQILVGPGMMVSADLLRSSGGWTEMGISEDIDFALKNLLKGTKTYYVNKAILYDEQPATVKDIFRRNMRMGRGLWHTFWHKSIWTLPKFFMTFKFSYLDAFLTQLFIPVDLIACAWLPVYYVFAVSYNWVIGNLVEVNAIFNLLGFSLVFFFLVPFILQAILVSILERKNVQVSWWRLLVAYFVLPLFMILYAIGIFLGIVSKAQWKPIARTGYLTQSIQKQRKLKRATAYKKVRSKLAKSRFVL